MKSLENIKNLPELLVSFETQKMPTFIYLCSHCNNGSYLIDKVVQNIQETFSDNLGYQKITGSTAERIKEALMIARNPVLLLINKGEIKAVFSGIIAQYQLEQALEDLGLKAA